MNPHQNCDRRPCHACALDILRAKLSAPTPEERAFTIRVTLSDGIHEATIRNVDLDSIGVEGEGKKQSLTMETAEGINTRIIHFPMANVLYWEAL